MVETMNRTNEEFETDIALLENAIASRPTFMKAINKLLVELDIRNVTNDELGLFSAAQIAMNSQIIGLESWELALLKQSQLKRHYNYWISILKAKPTIPILPNNQLFAGDGLKIKGHRTACPSYLRYFDETEVIPSLCFDCYKVQILAKNAKTLLNVYFLLRTLSLPRQNTRKIMAETRAAINNPYKAYIYCESISEAKKVKALFDIEALRNKITGISSRITHGCSEYSQKYPDFQYDEKDEHKTFNTPNWWLNHTERKTIKFAAEFTKAEKKNFISIREVLAINALVHYSKAIEDDSCEGFDYIPVKTLRYLARLEAQKTKRMKEMDNLTEILN